MEISYIPGKTGFFMKKRNALFESLIKVDSNPELEDPEESLTFIGKKIPMNAFRQWQKFAQGVAERDKHGSSEAALMLFYHPESQAWDAYPPKQKLTVASVDYSGVTEAIQRFREIKGDRKWLPAGTFHSHPGNSSCPSSTDEKDEEGFDGVHIIVPDFGKQGEKNITIHATATKQRFVFKKPGHIIDFAVEGELEVPEEWYTQIKFQRDVPHEGKGYPGGGGYGGYGYGSGLGIGFGRHSNHGKTFGDYVTWGSIKDPSKLLKKLGFSKKERKELLTEDTQQFFEELAELIGAAKEHFDDVEKSKLPVSDWELNRFKRDAGDLVEKMVDFFFTVASASSTGDAKELKDGKEEEEEKEDARTELPGHSEFM